MMGCKLTPGGGSGNGEPTDSAGDSMATPSCQKWPPEAYLRWKRMVNRWFLTEEEMKFVVSPLGGSAA
jgi:hypothetical protein